MHEDIFGLTQDAVAFDMGTNYHEEVLGMPVRLAFTLTNLGTNMRFGGDKLRLKPHRRISIRARMSAACRARESADQALPLPTTFRIAASAEPLRCEC